MKPAIKDFLVKHGLAPELFDHEELVCGFIDEMEKGWFIRR